MKVLHNKACKHCCIITPQNIIFYRNGSWQYHVKVCSCINLLLLQWVKKHCQDYKSFNRRANPATHDFISHLSNHRIQQQSFFVLPCRNNEHTVDSSGILNMNRIQIGALLFLSNKSTNPMFFRKRIIRYLW